MNSVSLVGRVATDPQLDESGETPRCWFSVAVDPAGSDREADFIGVTVFGKLAETVAQYKNKGDLVAIGARVRASRYESGGQTRYNTEIIGHAVEFLTRVREPETATT